MLEFRRWHNRQTISASISVAYSHATTATITLGRIQFRRHRCWRKRPVGQNRIHRNIDRLDIVEPSAPKPVQVNARSIFHRAEEIGGCWMLVGPTIAIFLKRIIEQLTSHDGFSQNIQTRSRLRISIGTKVDDILRIGHNGLQLILRHLHVIHNFMCRTTLRWVVIIELLLR